MNILSNDDLKRAWIVIWAMILSKETIYNFFNISYWSIFNDLLYRKQVHTDKSVLRRRRQSFQLHQQQANRRRLLASARLEEAAKSTSSSQESADQRILRKLLRSQTSYAKERLKRGEPWVPTQRLPRPLTTSASAVKKLERIGEIQGFSVQRQRLHEQQVNLLI